MRINWKEYGPCCAQLQGAAKQISYAVLNILRLSGDLAQARIGADALAGKLQKMTDIRGKKRGPQQRLGPL